MILSVGRFSYANGYGKGYDVLMKLSEFLDSSIGIYIVGDEPTQELLDWKQRKHLEHVHFVGFRSKKDLAEYYAAADLFTLLSRGDIWGVINEAMSYGLPIITSSLCIAGTELVEDGDNGYVVDLDNFEALKARFIELISDDALLEAFGKRSYMKIGRYAIRSMAETHKVIWGDNKHIKEYARSVLNICEKKIIIGVGQFIYRKGFDVLIKAAAKLPKDIGIYIIGGIPTDYYLLLKNELSLNNVHFVGFKRKNELALYYQAADCTAFPSREDIWGLITNESFAFGVPVVATESCISALEMVESGKNGYVVPAEDEKELAEKLISALSLDAYQECIKTAQKFTIEEMAKTHIAFFEKVFI